MAIAIPWPTSCQKAITWLESKMRNIRAQIREATDSGLDVISCIQLTYNALHEVVPVDPSASDLLRTLHEINDTFEHASSKFDRFYGLLPIPVLRLLKAAAATVDARPRSPAFTAGPELKGLLEGYQEPASSWHEACLRACASFLSIRERASKSDLPVAYLLEGDMSEEDRYAWEIIWNCNIPRKRIRDLPEYFRNLRTMLALFPIQVFPALAKRIEGERKDALDYLKHGPNMMRRRGRPKGTVKNAHDKEVVRLWKDASSKNKKLRKRAFFDNPPDGVDFVSWGYKTFEDLKRAIDRKREPPRKK